MKDKYKFILVFLGGTFSSLLVLALVLPQMYDAEKNIHEDLTLTAYNSCKNNKLKHLYNLLTLYKQNIEPYSYPPLDGGKIGSNWGIYLKKLKIGDKHWTQLVEPKVTVDENDFVCPIQRVLRIKFAPSTAYKGKVDYWFANAEFKTYFPNGTIEGSPADIPIAGDAPNNHGGQPVNVLLKNGEIKTIKQGDPLYMLAYGPNGVLSP